MVEKIITKSGVVLRVEKRITDDGVEVCLRMEKHEKCLLHWALRRHIQTSWQMPPQSVWPEGSRAFDHVAVQTPFLGQHRRGQIIIRLDRALDFSLIDFVLFFPDEDRWDNNHGRNYQIEIPRPERSSLSPVRTYEESLGDPRISGLAGDIIEKEMSPNSWTLMHRFNLCHDLLDKVRNNIDGLALIFVWLRFSAIRQLDWQRNYNTQPRELRVEPCYGSLDA
jgi:alpha-glucan,water dikinase